MEDFQSRSRSVAIRLVGFEIHPEIILTKIPVDSYFFVAGAKRGQLGNVYNEHIMVMGKVFSAGCRWGDAIHDLLDSFGGTDRLRAFIKEIAPRAAWLDLNLPLIGSPWVETSSISDSAVKTVAALGLPIGFEIFDYDPSIPSHLYAEKLELHPETLRES